MIDDFRTRFPDLTPVTANPALASINGIGLVLYGRRDYDPESTTFVKTRCLCVVYLPLLAIDSWRVANAQGGGWLLVGRCPISAVARFWNLLTLTGVLLVGLSIGWESYTSTPAYQARQLLAAGHQAETASQLLVAATDYRQVASGQTTHAPVAAEALAALARGPLAQAPEDVQTQVVALLAALPAHARASGTAPTEVAALAEQLAAAAKTPRQAIAILESAAPVLAKDRLAPARRAILDAAHAANPKDSWVAVQLALIAETAGDQALCRTLLEPCAEQLGDGEGARILGGIYAGLGRIEDSHRLLRPYVMARLKELQTASDLLDKTQESTVSEILQGLKNGDAGKAWYDRYDAAAKAGKDQMVQEWIAQHLKGNPAIAAAEHRLSAVAPVVSVALDLGIVTIQRAQTFTDPAKRTAELKEAEGIFLAIRGVAGETDAYRMWLGQVDYWLGKPKEGRALLDELLAAKKRAPQSLLGVATVLREVGDHAAARVLAEEAYTSATAPADRQQAATLRALLFVDLDDEIVWLERCDQSSPSIIAELYSVRGARAHREGRDQEAITEMNRSLEAWSAMPRNATSLNNSATVAQQLYGMSGDPEHLRIACSRLEEAHLLMPSNTILLNNLLSSQVSLAGADTVKEVLDGRAIGRALDADEFSYCYRDHAGREAVIARYHAAPAHQNLLSDADRLMLMSPREATSYRLIAADLLLSRDATALATFAARTATADIDHAATWGVMQEFLAGKRDAQMAAESATSIERLEQRVAALRTPGKEATLALALTLLVSQKMGNASFGQAVDLAECLAMADEAARLHPSHATTAQLVSQLINQAANRVAQGDPAFASMIKGQRRLLNQAQLFLCLASDGRWRAQLAGDVDLTRAAALTRADLQAVPEDADVWDWALLEALGDPGAAAVATQLRADPILPLQSSLNLRLVPQSAATAVNEALLQRLKGEPATAKAVLEAARQRGLPLAAEL